MEEKGSEREKGARSPASGGRGEMDALIDEIFQLVNKYALLSIKAALVDEEGHSYPADRSQAEYKEYKKRVGKKRESLETEFIGMLLTTLGNRFESAADAKDDLWDDAWEHLRKAFRIAPAFEPPEGEEWDELNGDIKKLVISEIKNYITSIQALCDIEKDGFYMLVQSAATNKLQKTLTRKLTDPKQLDLEGGGHIFAKDFRLHIKLYNDLQHGVGQSAARLLDALMIQATSEGLKDTLIKLPLKEYMSMRGVSDEKEIREQIKGDIKALESTSFEYKGKGKQRGAWFKISIAGGTVGQIKNGDIIFRFNQDFYDSFKASGTGKYMFMYFPREALRANIHNHPYTYWFARKIAEHKRMNLGKPNEDTISVKTLLDACPDFPYYEDVMRGSRDVTRRIIEPFERDMDELKETLSWHYNDGQPKNYSAFIESTVHITWKYYPDTKKLEGARAKSAQKRISHKKKTEPEEAKKE